MIVCLKEEAVIKFKELLKTSTVKGYDVPLFLEINKALNNPFKENPMEEAK